MTRESSMELKKQEHESQFSVWLIASILFHLLILLIIFLWYVEQTIQRHFMKKEPQAIPLTMTKEQLQRHQQQEAEKKKNTPVLWKDLKKPDKDLVYTLMPGRKAVTEPEQEQEKPSQPEKKSEALPKVEPKPEPKVEKQIQEQIKQPEPKPVQPTPKKQEQVPTQQTIEQFPPTQKAVSIPTPKSKSQRFTDLKENLLQHPKQHQEQLIDPTEQPIEIASTPAGNKPKSNDPTILKNKITLQDLKLGFSKFLQEGNNDILMQQGNTNQPPDAQALRLITYKQQLAHTMRDAIVTHHRYYLVQNLHGTKTTYNLTIKRNGAFDSLTMLNSSGHPNLDTIIKEALESIKLYPAVPNHISGETFSAAWTFLH